MAEHDKFVMGTGQAHELALAFSRNNWTNADVKKLSTGDLLAKLLLVVRGQAEVQIVKHLIDCDAAPFLPEGWQGVEVHRQGGQLEWNPARVKLYLSKLQKDGKVIDGKKLREELVNEPVLNANVLDYLLAHPELVPEEWKGKAVFFWGTIYRDADAHLYVRCLRWDGGRWFWHFNWLDDGWDDDYPAALLASE